jgi:hypothetical protein
MTLMGRVEYLREQLRFELTDRAMSLGIGIGFIAMAGTGIWAIVTGEPIGILSTLAGTGLAVAEFHEAGEASSNIHEFKAQIAAIEH